MAFSETADAKNAKSQHMPLFIHAFHDGIAESSAA
jgi:hypothetical protein